MATLLGMALGGWMSGKVFDLTGSYHAAFLNGIAWNLLNFSIAFFLLWRVRKMARGTGCEVRGTDGEGMDMIVKTTLLPVSSPRAPRPVPRSCMRRMS